MEGNLEREVYWLTKVRLGWGANQNVESTPIASLLSVCGRQREVGGYEVCLEPVS